MEKDYPKYIRIILVTGKTMLLIANNKEEEKEINFGNKNDFFQLPVYQNDPSGGDIKNVGERKVFKHAVAYIAESEKLKRKLEDQ